jgi:hypothetical protein
LCLTTEGTWNIRNVTVYFQDLGFDSTTVALVHDVVAGKDVGQHTGSFTAYNMNDGDSMLVKVTPKMATQAV